MRNRLSFCQKLQNLCFTDINAHSETRYAKHPLYGQTVNTTTLLDLQNGTVRTSDPAKIPAICGRNSTHFIRLSEQSREKPTTLCRGSDAR